MIRRALRQARALAKRAVRGREPMILLYHRVAEVEHDPWSLAVRPDRFEAQIAALKTRREVVPLDELLARRGASDGKPLAAVTFDDGYFDVLTNAAPILARHDCPATVFVTTGAVGAPDGFWWDELARILFEPARIPLRLALTVAGTPHAWTLRRGDPAERNALHKQVWEALRPVPEAERAGLLRELAAWAGAETGETVSDARAMTPEEVRELADGRISIGAHTITHPKLSSLSSDRIVEEIEGGKRACEAILGRPVDTFAYPFGDYDARSLDAVRACGFQVACTTQAHYVPQGCDPLLLPRFPVTDMDGASFARWLG